MIDVLSVCSMTLTQTERGYPPAIEHIGKPIYIKNEMGKEQLRLSSTTVANVNGNNLNFHALSAFEAIV